MDDSGLPKWLQDIIDKGTGLFEKAADLEIFGKQLEIAREAQAFQTQTDVTRQTAESQLAGGFQLSTTTLLIIVAGIGALVLLARR